MLQPYALSSYALTCALLEDAGGGSGRDQGGLLQRGDQWHAGADHLQAACQEARARGNRGEPLV